jgi:hypothetical protein
MYSGMILISNINTPISNEMLVYKQTDQNNLSKTQSKSTPSHLNWDGLNSRAMHLTLFCVLFFHPKTKSISIKPGSNHPSSPLSAAVFLHVQLTEKGRLLGPRKLKKTSLLGHPSSRHKKIRGTPEAYLQKR